jgi:hypothetical protein
VRTIFLSERTKKKSGLLAVDVVVLAAVLARQGKTIEHVKDLFQFFVSDATRLQANMKEIQKSVVWCGRSATPKEQKGHLARGVQKKKRSVRCWKLLSSGSAAKTILALSGAATR